MNVEDLARTAARMREAQKRCFNSRMDGAASWSSNCSTTSDSAIKEAKRLEARLDRCLAMILEGQKDLPVNDD